MENNIAIGMREIVNAIQAQLRDLEGRTDVDPHWQTCNDIAERFNLWEKMEGGEGFPLWLSHVVGGMMRDME